MILKTTMKWKVKRKIEKLTNIVYILGKELLGTRIGKNTKMNNGSKIERSGGSENAVKNLQN